MKETHAEFIEKARADYKKIGSIACPVFLGEKVYFNKYGFNHLIWKGKKMRPPIEQIRRLSLIQKAVEILRTGYNFESYRKMERNSDKNKSISTAHFWSFKHTVKDEIITVIVRQTNKGSKHFFSVMTPDF